VIAGPLVIPRRETRLSRVKSVGMPLSRPGCGYVGSGALSSHDVRAVRLALTTWDAQAGCCAPAWANPIVPGQHGLRDAHTGTLQPGFLPILGAQRQNRPVYV